VTNLSGGELQRVAIVLCLGKPADVYLIDEPSAYLDSEQRIACSKVLPLASRIGSCTCLSTRLSTRALPTISMLPLVTSVQLSWCRWGA
jgi:ABC-type Mn2+/Zn2+ transport system ATPase subunit